MKTLTNSETCSESLIRILLRLTISVIGRFSPLDHLSLDKAKEGLNKHVTEQFSEFTTGFQSKYYNKKRLSECRNKLFEEGCQKDF